MARLDENQVMEILNNWIDPIMGVDLVSAKAVQAVRIDGDAVTVEVLLGFVASPEFVNRIKNEAEELLRQVASTVSVQVSWEVRSSVKNANLPSLPGVKNIIAIASGKGGVGKSTTAVNLALALNHLGASVGILDADIYGPSQPMMLGIPEGTHPKVVGESNFVPVQAIGLQSMSIGYLTTENTPMVWRGPMASGALQQMLMQTLWQDVDYLIVDMPPGTGDIQLTLAQKAPVDGVVIVTTPQDVALLDARKGIEMFRKVNIPVLGIVENMAIHICESCGHEEAIFGQGGGEKVAVQYDTTVLGRLPLSLGIREMTDAGHPTVASAPDGPEAQLYLSTAQKLATALWAKEIQAPGGFPSISISDD
ncbi:MAG: iron-sulfur cluster carrier protein ApbC [Pseudomonadales bacterium]|nr:iron-sulfur cluster carrier protein ApbC [Pseudomonadales bacterium]